MTLQACDIQYKNIVKGVSANIEPGEIVGLIGPNGAGKTTLFNIISGFIRPTLGSIALNNLNITTYSVDKRAHMGLGYLPQGASIFSGLTVRENLLAVLELHNAKDKNIIIEQLTEEFSLYNFLHSKGGRLSGGQRRRAEIARCLCTNPKFLLFDEPMAGIDPISIEEMKQTLRQLKNKGLGILISDHNVDAALDITDKAYVLFDGQLLMQGTPTEVRNSKDVKRLYLG